MTTKNLPQKPLRVMPAVIIVSIQMFIRFAIPPLIPEALIYCVFAGILGGVAILIWWLFFSRAAWWERIFAVILIFISLYITSQLLEESIATANMGLMFILFSIPVLSIAFVAWAVVTRYLSAKIRIITMVITIIASTGFWALLRTEGMDGYIHHNLKWRWAKTAEEKFLENNRDEELSARLNDVNPSTGAEWSGFRGANRDGKIYNNKIETDWKKRPPQLLWKRGIGPGCSSMAIKGEMIYTQEQRGEYEMVTCYNLNNGELIWKHQDSARFWDSHAGAGPRSTPTISGDRIYTLGATGIINVLNAKDGSVIWSRNGANDTGVKPLMWGFAGSPLVLDRIVIFAIAGKLAAYDIDTGNPLWYGEDGGNSYSSPQAFTIDNVLQVVHLNTKGAVGIDPLSGHILWKHEWKMEDRILQPAFIEPNDFIISADGERGLRRISVIHENNNWTVKEVWSSVEMKLNFNDFFVHKGYAYGFDGPAICCIDLKDGKRVWKGNRYRGFMILLADQDLLVILSEKGELALVPANPNKITELSKIQAIKGRTWNHPSMAGDIIVTRNAEEMAAFKLAPAD